jgi:hypothetical protein
MMIPIWQAVIAALITGGIGVFVGMGIMAAVAMAHYDGDEQRSEPK